MRIATWNVNSLKARQEAVENWLARTRPDILLIQETKLGDNDAPVMAFAMVGYQLVHHGEGRWNGVAMAARDGLAIDDVVTNFGDGPVRDSGPGGAAGSEDDFDPFDEARMVAATVDGLRIASIYAPNGRVVGSPFYAGKLAWFERLGRWLDDEVTSGRGGSLVVGGDFNVAPTDSDVWDPLAVHGGTHVSEPERAAVRALQERGLVDAYRARHEEPGRYTWWDYRAGMFHKNFGMRIDLLLDRRRRRRTARGRRDRSRGPEGPAGPVRPRPLDHRPGRPGTPYEPDWAGALARIAKRTR